MSGQDGGMVDDGAVLWVVDDLIGDELRAERHHVQVRLDGPVLLQDLEGGGGGGGPVARGNN